MDLAENQHTVYFILLSCSNHSVSPGFTYYCPNYDHAKQPAFLSYVAICTYHQYIASKVLICLLLTQRAYYKVP